MMVVAIHRWRKVVDGDNEWCDGGEDWLVVMGINGVYTIKGGGANYLVVM